MSLCVSLSVFFLCLSVCVSLRVCVSHSVFLHPSVDVSLSLSVCVSQTVWVSVCYVFTLLQCVTFSCVCKLEVLLIRGKQQMETGNQLVVSAASPNRFWLKQT